MNHFFGTQYTQADLQRRHQQRRDERAGNAVTQNNVPPTTAAPIGGFMPPPLPAAQAMGPAPTHMVPPGAPDPTGMMNPSRMASRSMGDYLPHGIDTRQRIDVPPLQQNTMPGEDYTSPVDASPANSMMAFGGLDGNLQGYQFGLNAGNDATAMDIMRRQSSSINLHTPGSFPMDMSYQLPGSHETSFNGDMSAGLMPDLMDYTNAALQAMEDETTSPLSMYAPEQFQHFPPAQNMDTQAQLSRPDVKPDVNMGHGDQPPLSSIVEKENRNARSQISLQQPTMGSLSHGSTGPSIVQNAEPVSMGSGEQDVKGIIAGPGGVLIPKEPESPTRYRDIYSRSSFDMVRALRNVIDRKNPEIMLGKIDLACAFVVCDLDEPDIPIVYVSDVFERLTGYSAHELVGRNCRFLQSPTGQVQQGRTRNGFADDDSVFYLKERLDQRREAQRSIINYRKGGQPFLNLLTMVPITWDNPKQYKYVVGFQIDLVVKPEGLQGLGSGGTFTVNYSQGELPRYAPYKPSLPPAPERIPADETTMLLSTYTSTPGMNGNNKSWMKMLLENSDDVVHVLSLKGLFLYVSPSCRKVLQYEPQELVHTSLSAICHPSDIVPVTRELKDTTVGTPVNVVYRIRRKHSGYTWFDAHGCLNIEQGKGRKCIILVGRQRPVYSLLRTQLTQSGGTAESEFWTKLSTSGLMLFVSSAVRTLLDRSTEELTGTSFQGLVRQETKLRIGQHLERVRNGQQVTFDHGISNRRGLTLPARTTFYPGDATEGQKPTYVIGQTRLIKPVASRSIPNLSTSNSAGTSSNRGENRSLPPIPLLHHQNSTSSASAASIAASSPVATPLGKLPLTTAGSQTIPLGSPSLLLANPTNLFTELQTTRSSSWQFELRQMERINRALSEELASLLSSRKKRKRRKAKRGDERRCAYCGKAETPEWRRGPSGARELCNGCGLRWAKLVGRGGAGSFSTFSGGVGSSALSSMAASPMSRLATLTSTGSVSVSGSQSGSQAGSAVGKAGGGGGTYSMPALQTDWTPEQRAFIDHMHQFKSRRRGSLSQSGTPVGGSAGGAGGGGGGGGGLCSSGTMMSSGSATQQPSPLTSASQSLAGGGGGGGGSMVDGSASASVSASASGHVNATARQDLAREPSDSSASRG